jgi:hypothetical protein
VVDFYLKDEDQRVAENAVHMDDLDLIRNADGDLVAVAMKYGQHVCWRCGQGFNNAEPKLQRTEVKMGYSRILLHAQCEAGNPNPRLYFNHLRGMQVRRDLARAARTSESVATAASESSQKVST